jgi:L-fucose mutarotase/ribose pyranase (RbsD/FucU family)
MKRKILFALFSCAFLFSGEAISASWKSLLKKRLPEYGHRNWVVIADSAYPRQSAPGVETVYTGAGQLEVVKAVLEAVEAAKHVRPVVMLDAELKAVPEKSAPGVNRYRDDLIKLLGKRPVKSMPHENIIHRLDDAAKLVNVLILKTDLTIPYTSVFIELDCGYWSADQEKAMREVLNAGSPAKR